LSDPSGNFPKTYESNSNLRKRKGSQSVVKIRALAPDAQESLSAGSNNPPPRSDEKPYGELGYSLHASFWGKK